MIKGFFKFDKITGWLYPLSLILIYGRLYYTHVYASIETSYNELRFFLFNAYHYVLEPIIILIVLRLILMLITGQHKKD